MAVQFELYKTPMPKEKKNKVRYHAKWHNALKKGKRCISTDWDIYK